MGHLINPVSLQLKYHGSWKLTWSQFLRKDFAYFFFIDQYLKNLVKSIVFLKSFFNKFFFYELKFFIKNNIIIFYFSFKFIRKTLFRFYWKYTYKSYLAAKFLKFKKKTKTYRIFEKKYMKCQSFMESVAIKNHFIENKQVTTYLLN